jgi:hypothetical protein
MRDSRTCGCGGRRTARVITPVHVAMLIAAAVLTAGTRTGADSRVRTTTPLGS